MDVEDSNELQAEVKAKSKIRKSINNALISSLVLLVIALMAGAGYVYYVDHNDKATAAPISKIDTTQQYHTITPTIPDPKAPVGVAVEMISSPIARGAEASATIKTYPNAICSIKVMYNKVASTEAGLVNKTADSYGVVSWNWNIAGNVAEGSWPVNVTCAHHGLSGYVQGFVLVTAS